MLLVPIIKCVRSDILHCEMASAADYVDYLNTLIWVAFCTITLILTLLACAGIIVLVVRAVVVFAEWLSKKRAAAAAAKQRPYGNLQSATLQDEI